MKQARESLQVKGADMEETGLRGREAREKVRGDKVGQAFTGGKEKRRGVDGGGAQMEDARPCPSIAPCLHRELHANSGYGIGAARGLLLSFRVLLGLCFGNTTSIQFKQ